MAQMKYYDELTVSSSPHAHQDATTKTISKEPEMRAGNLTFCFPPKEHLLTELTKMLCAFR